MPVSQIQPGVDYNAPLPGIGISLNELGVMKRELPEFYAQYAGLLSKQAERIGHQNNLAYLAVFVCLILAGGAVGTTFVTHNMLGVECGTIIFLLMGMMVFANSPALLRFIDTLPDMIAAWKGSKKTVPKTTKRTK